MAEKNMVGNEYIEDRELTEDEKMDYVRENEDDLLRGLLDAADYASNEEMTFEIIRNGKFFFRFTVHPISEEKMWQIRKKYTRYVKNRRAGIRQAEELDVAKFRCSVIYNSTIDSDKAKMWDNKALWESLRKKGHNIINALDVIEAVLLPGEKDRIMNAIDTLSGYYEDEDDIGTENKQIDLAKN